MRPPHAVTQLVCTAASKTAGHHTIARESLTDDVQDEEDLEGYGFGV